ncbi:MAG: IclR family transcriptional regulator domain-containing protein [bacterium]
MYLSSIFSTATGMLLLSYLNKSERKAIIQREGIPEEKFRTREDLMKEIDRIREQSYVVNETSRGEIIQIAFPIKNKDEVVAALGVSLPRYRFKQNRQKILEFTKKWQRRQVFLYILEKVVTKRGVNYESGKTQYSYDNDRSASSRYDDLCR